MTSENVSKIKNEYLIHWQIQENLLQWYRSIFITSESIIISLGCAIVTGITKVGFIIFWPIGFLGILLLIYWRQIVNSRELDISYIQMQVIKCELGLIVEEQELTTMIKFKAWQQKNILIN